MLVFTLVFTFYTHFNFIAFSRFWEIGKSFIISRVEPSRTTRIFEREISRPDTPIENHWISLNKSKKFRMLRVASPRFPHEFPKIIEREETESGEGEGLAYFLQCIAESKL